MQDKDEWLSVDSLDLEGQGVARSAEGKVVFIDGALPGESVRVVIHRRKAAWEKGQMTLLGRPSPLRVEPRCPHFGLHAGACGGCKIQHLDLAAQVAVKQRALEDSLRHIGKVRPERILRPIQGPGWGYRYRARLSVRYVAKKGTVLVGFHERKSSYVADMQRCEVLPPWVSALLMPLRALVGSMDQRDRLPQIEVAVGDGRTALVLRHLEPLLAGDLARLRAFGEQHGVQWWLQPRGPDSVAPLDADDASLHYRLPEFGIEMRFKPTDFTQVNHAVNETLVSRAVRLLAPTAGERVIDWFCGLGNFTLPLARRARSVLGIEGSPALLERSAANAAANGLAARTAFVAANLFEIDADFVERQGAADKWLVDPPREGALALVQALVALRRAAPGAAAGWTPPRRIVYVSCNPATLGRDLGLLVHQAGYRCVGAGAVNMFPHTAHVESLAVLDIDPTADLTAALSEATAARELSHDGAVLPLPEMVSIHET